MLSNQIPEFFISLRVFYFPIELIHAFDVCEFSLEEFKAGHATAVSISLPITRVTRRMPYKEAMSGKCRLVGKADDISAGKTLSSRFIYELFPASATLFESPSISSVSRPLKDEYPPASAIPRC
jgi:hypothetical protein